VGHAEGFSARGPYSRCVTHYGVAQAEVFDETRLRLCAAAGKLSVLAACSNMGFVMVPSCGYALAGLQVGLLLLMRCAVRFLAT
jgi:hypothetical protein